MPLGAIAVILAWLKFCLILSGSPFIGIIFHMFFHVLRIISIFLLVFSPIFVGYTLCFFKLVDTRLVDTRENTPDHNFFNAIIKVKTKM